MTAYYNDNDPDACAWLRELIRVGAIPDAAAAFVIAFLESLQ